MTTIVNNCPFNVVPYDQSGLIKSSTRISLNYTNQDFYSLRDRLVAYIAENFGDQFNDVIESDLAIMLIELWAFIADTLSFKIDQIANEVYIDTVSEIDNLFRIALLVGFKATPPIASASLWTATINNVLTTDLTIPTPVIMDITTEVGPKTIELFAADASNNPLYSDDIIISSGNFQNSSIVGLEGKTRTQTNIGDGTMNQAYRLSFGPVISGSIRVQVDGSQWTQVDYFSSSQATKEFRVEYDANYNAFILFGDNQGGLIPSNGSTIQITYRTGGGVAGNVVSGLQLLRSFLVPGVNIRVPVTFQNYTPGQFGYDGDQILDIKRKLPQYLRTQNRAVTGSDYQTVAEQFTTTSNGSVGKASAVLRNSGCAGNIIDIYVLALQSSQGLATATNELKVALNAEFDDMKMLTDYVCIKDGEVLEVDISIDLVLDKFYKKFEDEVKGNVTNQTNTFFALNNWDFGKSLKAADLIKQISSIREINSTEIQFTTSDPTNSGTLVATKFYQVIRPQSLTINFVYE